ncbi:MAG: nitrophenyl compound nitroreductase subunit ArsF family protein [Rikenellaceae bacterium]
MNRVIVALFALMMIASCANNTTTKTEDSCCSAASTKSEASCCSSDTTNMAKCSNKCDSCSNSVKGDTCCELVVPGSVQILYMHGKQRCATCIAIGTEAEAVVKELANANVVMKTIDFSTPEGEVIADKYEIASSSIIIVKDGKVENLTAMAFQYAKSNSEQFKKNLKEAIAKMLE